MRGYLLKIILRVIHSVSQIELSLNPRSQCLHNLGSCHLEVAPALELIHWKNIFRLSYPLQYSSPTPLSTGSPYPKVTTQRSGILQSLSVTKGNTTRGWKKYVMVHLKELLHKTGALYKKSIFSDIFP